jgi:hypothetical protein
MVSIKQLSLLQYAVLSCLHVRGTYELVLSKARQVAVFLRTTRPSLALPFTMQYGTPILRHSAGRNSTICTTTSTCTQPHTGTNRMHYTGGCVVLSLSSIYMSTLPLYGNASGEEILTSVHDLFMTRILVGMTKYLPLE